MMLFVVETPRCVNYQPVIFRLPAEGWRGSTQNYLSSPQTRSEHVVFSICYVFMCYYFVAEVWEHLVVHKNFSDGFY